MKVLDECSCPCAHGERDVPHPNPLSELTVPRARPLNDDLQGDGRCGLVCGVAFGVVLGNGLGVVFGVVPGVRESSSGMPGGYAGSS